MKNNFCILLMLALFSFISCDNASTGSDDEDSISMDAYSSALDNAYYKVWSDNSWEEYNRIITIDSKTYITTITDEGTEYYYSSEGYAGFKPYGESLILFDKPMASLPDKVVFNKKYTSQTTFPYQGYNYTMKIEEILMDTVSVSVPCGNFNSCLWFKTTSSMTSLVESSTSNGQFWLAIGPSDIKQTLNSGTTITMVRGHVNGQNWGTVNLSELPNISKKQSSFSLADIIRPMTHFLK